MESRLNVPALSRMNLYGVVFIGRSHRRQQLGSNGHLSDKATGTNYNEAAGAADAELCHTEAVWAG
jgi:hypothetical protein